MLRWILLVKKLFATASTLVDYRRLFRAWRARAQVRRTMKRAIPILEGLEERYVPSASPENPMGVVAVASPPAAASFATVTSSVESTLNQWSHWYATFQQGLSNFENGLEQEIAQDVSLLRQLWDYRLSLNPNGSNSGQTTASPDSNDSGSGRGNSSGSGRGSGTIATTQTSTNQSHNISTQQVGRGSGSGSSSTNNTIVSKQGLSPVHPLTGSGSAGSNGSGTGSVGSGTGSGPATVYGQVWLDNSGDGSINNGEMGFQGITVELINPSTGAVYQSKLTNASGGYSFTFTEGPPPGHTYAVQVVLSSVPYRDFYATLRTPNVSQINANGTSASFNLAHGGWRDIEAGICSMDVTTLDDDPSVVTEQNQITLRDAIETGNNGGGLNQLLHEEPVRFINPLNGSSLTGTITLQAVLPAIAESYDIVGPGAALLTVNGNANPGSVHTIDAGVTSTISGETIKNGSSGNGGGVLNNGNLTLKNDTITANNATDFGGGVYNGAGSLKMSGDQIVGNTAQSGGGLYNNGGTVTITANTSINNNKALGQTGGGIRNVSGTVTALGGTKVDSNSTNTSGGGVANSGTFLMTGGEISNNFMLPGPNFGGGVYNPGEMRLLGVQVQGNSAVNGGGICTTGILVMGRNTSISDNKASSNGAGMYVNGGAATMLGGGITSNTAQKSGGGIYVLSGELRLQSSVQVLANTAVGNGGGGYGGGVYISGGKVTVSGGTMSFNTAGEYSGGGIYNWGGILTLQEDVNITANGAISKGGGIYLAGPFSTTTFNGVTVSGNSTSGNQQTTGWGVYWQNQATVNQPINLTDNDDPGGNPVKGP